MTRRKHCRKDKNFLVNFRCRGRDDLKWLPLRSSHIQRKNYFKFRNSGKSADFPELPFHGRGRNGKRHLQRRFLRKRGAGVSVLALSVFALQIHLSQRERPWHSGKVSGIAIRRPLGGAGCERSEQTEGVSPRKRPRFRRKRRCKCCFPLRPLP